MLDSMESYLSTQAMKVIMLLLYLACCFKILIKDVPSRLSVFMFAKILKLLFF